MIAPQNIERDILNDCLFSQVIVLGDKRNFIIALIVPNRDQLTSLALEHGIKKSWDELIQLPEIYRLVAERLRLIVANYPPFEQIKYFALLTKELTQESGELTPTLKIKRKVVQEKYQSVIDQLYDQNPAMNSVF